MSSQIGFGIPPNTPIVNTASATYAVAGNDYSASAAATVTSDAAAGNSAPSGLSVAPGVIVENELQPLVGDLSAIDSDPGDTHTFALAAGADPRFEIVGTQLRVVTGQSFNFEIEAAVDLPVVVTDNNGAQSTLVLNVPVQNVNEPPFDILYDDSTVPFATPGAAVTLLTSADPDVGDSHTYAVSDPRFVVTGNQLQLTPTEALADGETVTLTITTTDAGGLTYSEAVTLTTVPPQAGSGNNSSISFLQQAPGVPGSVPSLVNPARCSLGGSEVPVSLDAGLRGLTLPGNVDLLPGSVYKSGENLFVQVVDPDANQDAATIDDLLVTLTTPGGDSEQLRLFETGANTSVFVGHVPTAADPVAVSDCVLQVAVNETVQATYTDAADASDVASAAVLVDPFGVVFDAATGQLVDGALVTLIDLATGQPASVFGDDGVSAYPNQVVSGGAVTDASGQRYDFASGAYRFPFVAPGNYRLDVQPPNRFSFPSTAADAEIQTLPTGPYALGPGSRGASFAVPVGPAVRVDVPLDLQALTPTPGRVEWQILDAANGTPTNVPVAACADGGGFTAVADPVSLAAGALALPATLGLMPSSRLSGNDVAFITVTDPDRDLDPFAADTVEVVVSAANSAELETVQLGETGPSTGIFVGYLPTGQGGATAGDCTLSGDAGTPFEARYVDADDPSDTASALATLDPGFRLFSSINGAPIDGVQVTLIDATTGAPATNVFLADGVTPFPATVTSGAGVTVGGATIEFAPGGFYFPSIAPGDYRLRIDNADYRFPSQVTDGDLALLASGPFVLMPGSRGAAFTVAGANPAFDIPLDPLSASLVLNKSASKDVAAVGDHLQYLVTLSNAAAAAAAGAGNVVIEDRLPQGLRYVVGSARLDDVPLEPAVSADGSTLSFALPALTPAQDAELRYVARVGADTPHGNARNRVRALGTGLQANEAVADVLIRDDLLRRKATIVGRVIDGDCDTPQRPGLANARVWLEDGTYVITDHEGKFHFEGVEPGSHVLQLDTDSLPAHYELLTCEQDSRRHKQAHAIFVDVAAGTLWREDFYVRLGEPEANRIDTRLLADADDGHITYRYFLRGSSIDATDFKATFLLPDSAHYVAGSARVNGERGADPQGVAIGALTFAVTGPQTEEPQEIRFRVRVDETAEPIETKAVTAFKTSQGQQRTPVLTSRLHPDWPATLVNTTTDAGRQPQVRAEPQISASGLNGNAYEPSRSGIRTDTGYSFMEVAGTHSAADTTPYVLPEIDAGRAPEFDMAWLHQQPGQFTIAWPPVDYNPRLPSVAVAVVHPQGGRPALVVDGELVNPITFEGTTVDHARGLAVTSWDNVSVSEGDSTLTVSLSDAAGGAPQVLERQVHFRGAPVRAELLLEESYLVADGIHPPMLAVRLFDRSGRPVRPGLTGEYGLQGPLLPLNESRLLGLLENTGQAGVQRYRVRQDGIAYIRFEPTTETGEIALNFQFNEHRHQTLRARVRPGSRDWIMVGLAEGVITGQSTSGPKRLLPAGDDDVLTDGRVAFYAKGMIKGEWLLTASYDTDKESERRIREQIDPNRFYTLYGDGTEQRYDAQSRRKLYLKLEKGDFTALFGDFDTGFDRTEYTRYARSLNGLQAEHYGARWKLQGFASETAQRYVRDEIRGDGTSGIYRLGNRRIVVNSERISLVTRNRFRPQEVEEAVALTRYRDYSIDYDRGTLLFKQPVFSQDTGFNPIYIEAEYELEGGAEDWVAGARLAYRLDDQDSEVAVTYVDDSNAGSEGSLTGADVSWRLGERTRVVAELAQTDTPDAGTGQAYRLEVEQQGERLAGRAFWQEQDADFGLDQQAAINVGARTIGLEGEYRLNDSWRLRGEAFAQNDLDSDGERTVVAALAEYQAGSNRLLGGLRSVDERTAAGDDLDAQQLVLGASRRLADNRLTLRADSETVLGQVPDAGDYPHRLLLGAEYDVTSRITLVGEHEFTWADLRDTQDTRFGIRTRPWAGAELRSHMTRQVSEESERLFATTGLLQQWRLNDNWSLDAGLDRVDTVTDRGTPGQLGGNGANLSFGNAAGATGSAQTFRPGNPPASGSFDGDFTAVFAGATYRSDIWEVASRAEFHNGDESDKWNLLLGAHRQLEDGKIISSSLALLTEDLASGGQQDSTRARVGLAWRPVDSRWLFLNRLDYEYERQLGSSFSTRSRKFVDNFNANWRPNERSQLSLQAGVKHVLDRIDAADYDSFTGLFGMEYRHDVGRRWDVGLRAAALRSFDAGETQYSAGVSVGVALFGQTWTSLGYNVVGFIDDDFDAAEYTARGFYLKLRLRLDQQLMRRFLGFLGSDTARDGEVVR